jgi:hypothetical protein
MIYRANRLPEPVDDPEIIAPEPLISTLYRIYHDHWTLSSWLKKSVPLTVNNVNLIGVNLTLTLNNFKDQFRWFSNQFRFSLINTPVGQITIY